MHKDKKVSVIIAAAGSGKRMGGGLNKQYIKLRNMPVLARSVRIFNEHETVDEIIITVRKGEEELCRQQKIVMRDVYGEILPGEEEAQYVRWMYFRMAEAVLGRMKGCRRLLFRYWKGY